MQSPAIPPPEEQYILASTRHFRLVHANRLFLLLGTAMIFIGLLCCFVAINCLVPVVISTLAALTALTAIVISCFTSCSCGKTLRSPVRVKRVGMPFMGIKELSILWPLFPLCICPFLPFFEVHTASIILGITVALTGVGLSLYGLTDSASQNTIKDIFLESTIFDLRDLETKTNQELQVLIDYALQIGELERADLLSKCLLDRTELIDPL